MTGTTPEQQKAVLVTGGSAGGIGHATAVAFAKLGHKVAITGLDKDRLREAVKDLKEAAAPFGTDPYANFMALEVDFMNSQQVDELIPMVVAKFGRLDILVNSASFAGKRKELLDKDFYEDFLAVMQVNLLASTRIVQLAAPYLLQAPGGGVIINVSSVADRFPLPQSSFCVSKAGLSMLTKTLANSFEGKNVRVVTVSPGPIETKIMPEMKRFGELSTLAQRTGTSEEAANVIVFLASDKASYMTGTTVDVDGGMCCKAGLLLSRAASTGEAIAL